MQWSEVRNLYPSQWVLVEAIAAATQGNKRVVDQLSVADTTLLSAEIALELGLEPEFTDTVRTMRGIGGEEFVYEKKIDSLRLGDAIVSQLAMQIGAMDCGTEIYIT